MLSKIAARFVIHPNLVSLWERQTVEGMSLLCTGEGNRHDGSREPRIKELHEKIGQQTLDQLEVRSSG